MRHSRREVLPTRSKHDPPPKYSMTIHSLWPLRKLEIYWVTKGLAHVLSTDISCCISRMSSSLDSRSICTESALSRRARREKLTCLMATTSPDFLSMAL